ncbi:MAG: HU family DNA-binding protein [Phycisphaerae bacterium]|nr:HU family DNA-binding protein [Phycisphaerae bacterium]
MATITKKELIDRIADRTGNKRVVVKRIIQNFLDEIIEELGRGNRLEFRDFGVFESRMRAERVAQNPKTLERVHVPSKRTVKFKVGRLMKQKLSSSDPEEQEGQGQSPRAPEQTAEMRPPLNPGGGES